MSSDNCSLQKSEKPSQHSRDGCFHGDNLCCSMLKTTVYCGTDGGLSIWVVILNIWGSGARQAHHHHGKMSFKEERRMDIWQILELSVSFWTEEKKIEPSLCRNTASVNTTEISAHWDWKTQVHTHVASNCSCHGKGCRFPRYQPYFEKQAKNIHIIWGSSWGGSLYQNYWNTVISNRDKTSAKGQLQFHCEITIISPTRWDIRLTSESLISTCSLVMLHLLTWFWDLHMLLKWPFIKYSNRPPYGLYKWWRFEVFFETWGLFSKYQGYM